MTNPTDHSTPAPTTTEPAPPEPTAAEESAFNGTAQAIAAEFGDDEAAKALDAGLAQDLKMFEDPTTSAGQGLLALRTDFGIAAEKLFRRHLSPKTVLALDEAGGLRKCAVAFCTGAVERDY